MGYHKLTSLRLAAFEAFSIHIHRSFCFALPLPSVFLGSGGGRGLGGLLKATVAQKKYRLNRKIFVLQGALKIISVLQAYEFGDVSSLEELCSTSEFHNSPLLCSSLIIHILISLSVRKLLIRRGR